MTDDCVPLPLAESDWLDRTVTDLDGRRGVVRRVYQVGAVQVAILTTADQSPDPRPIWDMPLDLLAGPQGPEGGLPRLPAAGQ
ncbi:hypothetical protein [Streptomyces sp. NPDC001787]|uniref:hypothetical protein n=1 Tax=Streptomyces sp. NPDC001787 TaxID=3154523 RepID=UPI00331A36CE